MISQRKLEANRRNARQSTGPKTAEGKARVRLNAVKHGMTAETPVLPHEDAEAYRRRLEAWTSELNPRSDVARYLVERAVKTSWKLDRADRHEVARLSRRIRETKQGEAATRAETLDDLLARLVHVEVFPAEDAPGVLGEEKGSPSRGPANRDEEPATLVQKLEATAEGCRRLQAVWLQLGEELEVVRGWSKISQQVAFRLLGLRPEGVRLYGDPLLLLIDRAGEMLEQYSAANTLARLADEDEEELEPDDPFDPYGPSFDRGSLPLTLAEYDALLVKLRAMVDEACARLAAMAAERERSGDDPAGLAIETVHRASFDDSAEGDRLHRYQLVLGRSLLRTLELVRKLDPGAADEPPTAADEFPVVEDEFPTVEEDLPAAEPASEAPETDGTTPTIDATDAPETATAAPPQPPDTDHARTQNKATANGVNIDDKDGCAETSDAGEATARRPAGRPAGSEDRRPDFPREGDPRVEPASTRGEVRLR
jgi:hypothetical protein